MKLNNRTGELNNLTPKSKRIKIDTDHMNSSLVPSPIKVKFENKPEKQELISDEDDIELPLPSKIKKEKIKNIKSATKIKKKSKHNLEGVKEENSQDVAARRSHSKRSTPLKIKKDVEVSESNVSSEASDSEGTTNSRLNSTIGELNDCTTSNGQREGHLPSDDSSASVSHTEKSEDKPETTEKLSWIRSLKMENPGLRRQNIDFKLPHTKYSILRVPKSINPHDLKNLNFSFRKEVLANDHYLFRPLVKKPEPVFIIGDNPLLVNLDKVIVVNKSVSEPVLLPLQNFHHKNRGTVPLPDNIKVRHPLFGINYKEKIAIGKKVKKKLKEAIEHKARQEKKERKRKQKQKNYLRNEEKPVFDLLNTIKKNL